MNDERLKDWGVIEADDSDDSDNEGSNDDDDDDEEMNGKVLSKIYMNLNIKTPEGVL